MSLLLLLCALCLQLTPVLTAESLQISQSLTLPLSIIPALYSSTRPITACSAVDAYTYYDSTAYACVKCSGANQIADTSVLNGYGDPVQCRCAVGFKATFPDCSQSLSETCTSLVCSPCTGSTPVPTPPPSALPTQNPSFLPTALPTDFNETYAPSFKPVSPTRLPTRRPTAATSAPQNAGNGIAGYTSTSDNSMCIPCSADYTQGINPTTLDCLCPVGMALIERDTLGNVLPAKVCRSCPAGTLAVLTSGIIAGKLYKASAYNCQACPGPYMSMVISAGAYSCVCQAGYTLTGVASIGVQSCVSSALLATHASKETSAEIVQYKATTLRSVTFLNYFSRAAGLCHHAGGPDAIASCQILANLCVLSLYDAASQSCAVFNAILKDRPTVQKSIPTWGHIMPWLYYAGSPCLDPSYNQLMSLRSLRMDFVLAEYTMNGTFTRYMQLDEAFAYCKRIAPYGKRGGGAGVDNSWQIFGTSQTQSLECDLPSLIGRDQYFYELFLHEPLDESVILSAVGTGTSSSSSSTSSTSSSGSSPTAGQYFPVPVRIVGVANGIAATSTTTTVATDDTTGSSSAAFTGDLLYPSSFLCDKKDYTVRRFFLYDIVSGLTTDSFSTTTGSSNQYSTTGGSPFAPIPRMIRYASNIVLQVGLQAPRGDVGKIYVPIMTIAYEEISPQSWSVPPTTPTGTLNSASSSTGTIVPYQIRVIYAMDFTQFLLIGRNFWIPAMIILGFIVALRFRNWIHRKERVVVPSQDFVSDQGGGGGAQFASASGDNFWGSRSFFELSYLSIHSWTMMFFPFMLLLAWYCFTLFKLQSTPAFMLPPQDNIYSKTSPYYPFVVNLYMMAIFQLVSVIVIIYRQATAEIMLIDWESTRAMKALGSGSSKSGSNINNGVSVWRSILIANEWNELQTTRKTDIRFTMFFIGLILIGSNLQYDATQQPVLGDKSPGEFNVVLRFASSTWWWVMFTVVQLLWKFFVYERYISEIPAQQFIDLCTIAKVSVFVLDEPYHGYYLHCRSPHQFADGTMMDLVEMLHREEAGLTVDRSLDGAPADVQSFEIYLSSEFRTNYQKIYNTLNPPTNQVRGFDLASRRRGPASRSSGGPSGGAGSSWGMFSAANTLPPERVVKAWREMNVFLKEVIDNNFGVSGLRRAVREKTYVESFLHVPPFLSVSNLPSVFFPDRRFDFTKVTFLGQELNLILLNILSYALFELWTNSAASAMLMTYLLDRFLIWLRSWLGQGSLAKNTLIDERFLV